MHETGQSGRSTARGERKRLPYERRDWPSRHKVSKGRAQHVIAKRPESLCGVSIQLGGRRQQMDPSVLEEGYWQAYQDFYRWSSIFRAAGTKARWVDRLRHLLYAGGWKKFEPMWELAIRVGQVKNFLPVLETILAGTHGSQPSAGTRPARQGPLAAANWIATESRGPVLVSDS